MNKIRLSFICVLLLFFSEVIGQTVAPSKYYIQFTDKNNSPYSISNPEAFLTARALARRTAHGIAIQENDLPVNPQYIQEVAAQGVTVLEASRWLNGVVIYATNTNLVNSVETLPFVNKTKTVIFTSGQEKEKPFFKNETYSKVNPNIPMKASSFTEADYGYALTQIKQISGIHLHDAGYLGQNMVIAVLDGGFSNVPNQTVFDSIHARNGILGTKDFVYPDGDVYTESGHGREVLSCMAADEPGLMIGTAPDASYWLLRSEDVKSENLIEEYNWVCAAEFADSVGADIINSSLGYIGFDDSSVSHTYADMNGRTAISTIGAEIAASKGILVVNSAGNSGADSSFPWIDAPADGDSVFTIGAVDANGNRVYFSSIGPTYDGRIKPTVMALGLGATVADANNGILFGNGTSFSSPIIAGMCACLWQAHPNVSNIQIINALKETASNHTNPDNYMGWGIANFAKADSLLSADSATGVNEIGSQDAQISLFPNPFHLNLHIEVRGAKGRLYLSIYNLSGQKIFEKVYPSGMTSIIIGAGDLSFMSQGIYLMKLTSDNHVYFKKLVKN
ncbi:MAG: S8 family serine peptidase [Bacteroidales bacterium]|nr:S8 family serine peptidase [Bacteroidales bacterium]